MRHAYFIILFFLGACYSRQNKVSARAAFQWSVEKKVELIGYSGNIMEPFLSRDGNTLIFNNLNALPENTNLHWARKINDSSFRYAGEISGINSTALEGVASVDASGKLYFVSTRNYSSTLSAIFRADYSTGMASDVQLVDGISKRKEGWVNFDVEVSANGKTLYFVDGLMGPNGIPQTADLVMAQQHHSHFERIPHSSVIMKNVNTDALEYAACISVNQRELYFTRLELPISARSVPQIFYTQRANIDLPFDLPTPIPSISGFAEAATLAPDQRTLYYHKKEGNRFYLFMTRRLN